jgi:hypothetical protein
MLIEQKFSESDLRTVKATPRLSKLFFYIFAFVSIPVAFIPGVLGYLKKGSFNWLTTIFMLAMFGFTYIYVSVVEYIKRGKDISRQEKWVGQLLVKSKSKKNETIIYFESSQFKKIEIYSRQIFDKIEERDLLTIEVAKFTKYLFRLERNGQDLLDNR